MPIGPPPEEDVSAVELAVVFAIAATLSGLVTFLLIP